MSSAGKYARPVDVNERWTVAVNSPSQFTWEYDDGRDRLLSLYQKGKDKQWDTTKRIDWSLPVVPHDPIGLPEEFNPFRGVVGGVQQGVAGRDRGGGHWWQCLHGGRLCQVPSRVAPCPTGPPISRLRSTSRPPPTRSPCVASAPAT